MRLGAARDAEGLPNYFDRTMRAHSNGGGDAADERPLNPPHARCADENAVGGPLFGAALSWGQPLLPRWK